MLKNTGYIRPAAAARSARGTAAEQMKTANSPTSNTTRNTIAETAPRDPGRSSKRSGKDNACLSTAKRT